MQLMRVSPQFSAKSKFALGWFYELFIILVKITLLS